MNHSSCTARLIRPFVRILASHPHSASLNLERLTTQRLDERVPLALAHEMVRRWSAEIGDPALGLKAGRRMSLGDGGSLEFAMHSAHSVRESVAVANRYVRLYSDALELALAVSDQRALLKLDSALPLPREFADFLMSAWYQVHVRVQLLDEPELECLFMHEQPEDLSEYRTTFEAATLTFGAPCYGFRFTASLADAPLSSCDALLHARHCEYLEVQHASLRETQSTATQVRRLLAAELRHGRPTAADVARRLSMSRRTMVRRLEGEGTSFTELLDDLRYQLALRFVAAPKLTLNEISDLLGFAQVQGFHRAFKRWNGKTPNQYRDAAIYGA
jgi:AraC-like DNA-binding protein